MPLLESGARILVAEDDAELNRLVATWLRRANLEVDTAFDGEEAIEAIKSTRYAVILLDIMMPRVNGVAVIDYITEHQPKLLSRVIVTTAGGEEITDKISGRAIYRLITKPFDLRHLLDSARECAQQQAGAQLSFSRDIRSDGERTHVLIVNADAKARDKMSKSFSGNFNVDIARNGKEAIEKLKLSDYDVVLLDLGVPGVDGLGVIGYLREHQKHVLDNVVLVRIPPEELDQVADVKVGGVIPRPVDAEELASYVKAHLLRTGTE